MKEIYRFKICLPVENEEQKEGGVYTFVLKKPTRRELEEADTEFAIEMSRCVKKGILTKAMLAKKYSDTGGVMSEGDSEKLLQLYSKLSDLESSYAKAGVKAKGGSKASRGRMEKIGAEIVMARRDIVDLESSYHTLFNHTADTKAQSRVVLWYLTHLSYFFKGDQGVPTSFFEGDSFEDKIEDYYSKDESGDKLFFAASPKLTALISYWYFSEQVETDVFDRIVKDFDAEE